MQLIFPSCQILKCWNWAFIIPVSSAAHLFATPCLQILFSDGLTKMAARVGPSSTLCMMGVWKEAHLPNDWSAEQGIGFQLKSAHFHHYTNLEGSICFVQSLVSPSRIPLGADFSFVPSRIAKYVHSVSFNHETTVRFQRLPQPIFC